MAHKIRIFDAKTNKEIPHQDWYFIGTDNKVYFLADRDVLVPSPRDLYWKFDMIEVKH